MGLRLSIGGEELRLVGSPEVLDAVAERYGPFLTLATRNTSSRAPIILEIRCRPDQFAPAYEQAVEALARESAPGEITLGGAVCGHYSVARRQGAIEDASGLGAVDCLLRMALSAALPLDGALLLHGAALRKGREGGIALCGASGSGKSTAAAALGGFCDEYVVLRPTENGLWLYSTPYWAGRPSRTRCATVVCLARGGNPEVVRLRGAATARALAPHVVRYLAVERIDRAVLGLLCSVAARVDVRLASCPEGERFIPFLRTRLRFEEDAA
jgi:hypothetical protein